MFKLTAQLGEMRPDYCLDRDDCEDEFNDNSRYSCNVAGDEWCSFSTQALILTPNNEYKTDLTQSGTYPYWYWVYPF
ncbi:hypothetical protein HC766_04665 [Candidatus Gracilibacteria bacterium]|nr:hypothetical protein [Candidatus Gracilibacteria bacterium]NJS41609.1 hypothetical protein [Candidatus Gracilibacteria bacterium]